MALSDGAKAALYTRFAITALLPRAFNRADTQAEWVGLRFSFLEACVRAWTRVSYGERHDLTDIYAKFIEKANHTFEISRLLKEARSIDAKATGDEQAAADRQNESEILEAYRENKVTATFASAEIKLTDYID